MNSGKEEPTYNYMLSPYGTEYGVTVGQQSRVDDLNNRILDRMFPDMELQPNFDPRPISTKYSIFPIVDSYQRSEERFKPYLDYYPEVIFNPGNDKAPVSGFLNKIDLETDLRDQRTLLTKKDLGSKYVPSKNSDMYKVNVAKSSVDSVGNAMESHPYLFSPFLVESSADNLQDPKIGQDNFHNHTRYQLRTYG